jgi:hypothetical protein
MSKLVISLIKNLSKCRNQFFYGEFVKECFVAAAEVVCSNKANAFKNISLYRMTVTTRVGELTLNVEKTLKTKLLAWNFAHWYWMKARI